MFLIEKLPRDNAQSSDEPMGTGVMLSRTIAAELALCLVSPWTPAFCKKDSTAWSEGNSWMEVSVLERDCYSVQYTIVLVEERCSSIRNPIHHLYSPLVGPIDASMNSFASGF